MKKTYKSENYNWIFDDETGFFARWGKTIDEDPEFSPIGPEIMDLELVKGKCKGGCSFCYKGNGSQMSEHYMDLATYKKFLDKLYRDRIKLTLEDGTVRLYEINDIIFLENGTTILAKDLKETDIIV